MTDVRALQVLLDGGVTDPTALLAAMPSGTTHDVARAIDVLSPMALDRVCCVCELGDPKPGGYLCRDCAADQGWWPQP